MDRVPDRCAKRDHSHTPAFDWHGEPDVAALLAEPIVRLMMARDGVSPQEVMTLVDHLRHAPVNDKH